MYIILLPHEFYPMKMTSLTSAFLFAACALRGQIPSSAPAGDSTLARPVAEIACDSTFYDFGKVKQGEMVRHTFHFTNKGSRPYVIQDVKTTCGCTVPEWPRDTIPPGGAGEVRVNFNTGGKSGRQLKIIRVVGNTSPPEMILQLGGEIKVPRKRKAGGR